MAFLSARTLGVLRKLQDNIMLSDLADLYMLPGAAATDAYGTPTEARTLVVSDVKCLLLPRERIPNHISEVNGNDTVTITDFTLNVSMNGGADTAYFPLNHFIERGWIAVINGNKSIVINNRYDEGDTLTTYAYYCKEIQI